MMGEGSPGFWFFAKNSGKNLREKEPSGSLPISAANPLKLFTSLSLLPEAREMRNNVLKAKFLRFAFEIGS